MDDLALGSRQLVTEFGTVGVVDTSVHSKYNPQTGKVESTSTRHAVLMYRAELTLQSNGTSLRYGTQFQDGDSEAYIIPPDGIDGFKLLPNASKITFLGVTYTVAALKTYEFRGKVFFITAYLRR